MIKLLLRNSKLIIGIILVCITLICGLFSNIIAPYNFLEGNLRRAFEPGFWSWSEGFGDHILGTDYLGRDNLSRILQGMRMSLLIGGSSTLLAAVIGLSIGLFSSTIHKGFDTFFLQIANAFLTFPAVLLALVMIQVFGLNLENLVIVLSLTSWPVFYRVVRSQALVIRNLDYIVSAKALGCNEFRILFRHILPNLFSSILVLISLELPRIIIAESFLSYLGFGIQPPNPSLGGILSDNRKYIFVEPWLTIFPGIAIASMTLGFNLLGDSLRDLLDPKLRGEIK